MLIANSLISLKSNERLWAIRSEEMSDCERIAQVAHQKWANEWIAHFFERIAHSLIFGQKTSDLLGKPMSKFPAQGIHKAAIHVKMCQLSQRYNQWA